jgi:hypothetical protein
MADAPLAPDVEAAIDRLRPRDVAVALLTYNNAETVGPVAAAAREGLDQYFPDLAAALIGVDAESADTTREELEASGLPLVLVRHGGPITERVTVPFHGVPGRGAALNVAFRVARGLGARALVLIEADAVTATPQWLARLAGPVLEAKADYVAPLYARHPYEGTMTKLLLAPLVRALFGRRLHQPFGGQQAFSARLLDHVLVHPGWDGRGREAADIWIFATAIADGFAVAEAWLGPYAVRSQTRAADLPAMMAQTLGSAFAVMERDAQTWLEIHGSEPLPVVGEPSAPPGEPAPVDVERMLEGFRLGARDLTSIWELVLTPETLGDVLALGGLSGTSVKFPDALWARIVYEFALAHHYGMVHRDHLLRSLVPIYLGRTAAFVQALERGPGRAPEPLLEQVGVAFERQKPYLVERWR